MQVLHALTHLKRLRDIELPKPPLIGKSKYNDWVARLDQKDFWAACSGYLGGIVLWPVISVLLLRKVNPKWWEYRDDSVIPLSEAANFAAYGTIGLNPGARVEAFSSPLNFLLSLITFKVKPTLSYERYLDFFIPVTLLILGLAITWSLRTIFLDSGQANLKIFIVSISTFLLVTSSWTTFGWLTSGMENILCSILLVLIIGCIKGKRKSYLLLGILVGLLGIARVELSVLLFPIIFFSITHLYRQRKIRGMFLFVIALIWIVTHSARYFYFGQLLPNTATALGKSLTASSVIFLTVEYLMFAIAIFKRKSILNKYRINQFFLLAILLTIGTWKIFEVNYTFMYLIIYIVTTFSIVAMMGWVSLRVDTTFNEKLIICLVLIPFNHYILFGPARLSAFRIVSAFIVPVVLFAIVLLIERRAKPVSLRLGILITPVILGLGFSVSQIDHTRNLCCSISPSEKIILKSSEPMFSTDSRDSPNPIVASPDLGKLSFTKKVVHVDLGLIGEPLLAQFSGKNANYVTTYLRDYVSPDIFELHGHWACAYSSLLSDEKFREGWKIHWKGYVSNEFNVPRATNCPGAGTYTVWKRRVPPREKQLTDFISNANEFVVRNRIDLEIKHCLAAGREKFRCQYVARSILRNREKLIEENNLHSFVSLLAGSPTYKFDLLRITEPRGWAKNGVTEFLELQS